MSRLENKPTISIITACLNRADFIADAVESVLQQNYTEVEHLVIDGGSTDGTLEVLSRYPHLHVTSEPDQGVYDAWNKGLNLAQGQIVGFLNSDDLYAANTFYDIAQVFVNNPNLQALMGKARIFRQSHDQTQETILVSSTCPIDKLLQTVPLSRLWINAWFFRKSLFDQIGQFNWRYRLSSDREFLFRLAAEKIRYQRLEKIIYQYREHAGSLTFSNQEHNRLQSFKENLEIAERLLSEKSYPSEVRKASKFWHSRRALDLTAFYWRKRDLLSALRYALRGWRYNPSWPLFMMRKISPLTSDHPNIPDHTA